MKAVEINVVAVDAEDRIFSQQYNGVLAQIVMSWVSKAAALLQEFNTEIGSDAVMDAPEFVGPVLRKVTEVTGHVEDTPGDEAYISSPGDNHLPRTHLSLSSIIPDECRKDCTDYRFRFVCEAVRVPDPERDAKDLSGLPGKEQAR